MLLASATGLIVLADEFPLLCVTSSQTSGANVAVGARLALAAGIVGLLPLVLVRLVAPGQALLMRFVLLAEVAALSIAVGFVARDSATFRQTEDCGFFDDTTTHSAGHVDYGYVLWGIAVAVLLVQAFRGLDEQRLRRLLIGAFAATVSVCVAVALAPVHVAAAKRTGVTDAATRPPKGILVCRAFDAPEVFGGPQCATDAAVDVGRAPIAPPDGLMCSTDLDGVKGQMIGIRVSYGKTLIKHANLRASDVDTSPYAYFDVNDVEYGTGRTASSTRLPAGRYRCRFLVDNQLVRERTVRVRRRPA